MRTPRSSAWLIFDLLAGLGLVAWLYIVRQQSDYDAAGFSLAQTPASKDAPEPSPFQTEPSLAAAQEPAAWLASRPAASTPAPAPQRWDPDPGYVDALRSQAPARPAAAAARSGDAPLTEEEASALSRAMGGWDDASASRLGGDVPLLVKAVEGMLDHPRIARHVLDNGFVIRGYLNGPGRPLCSSPQALADFLSDTSDPNGVSMFLASYNDSRAKPGAVDAVLGSMLAKTLARCPSVPGLYQDPKMVTRIIRGNPKVLLLLADPPLIQGLRNAPYVLDAVNSFQAAYTQAGGDS